MFQLHYFVNQPYLGYPHEAAAEFGAVMLKFSNRYFDGERAAALFERYHQEFQVAEQVGFDSILVNEHHNAPAAMSPSPNMSAAVLAKITSRAKIFIGGNILPVNGNPVRLAEELAMIDLFSKGRLICGFVRGGAVESLAMSVNTLHNREMFEEAHDLILKTWTQPGPFVWEGKHYQYRCVNPWALPMQKPHPPIMIPGSTSRETVEFAALRGYPYIALATRLEATDELFAAYDEIAEKAGHATTADRRGYFTRVHVAPTEEQAHEEGQALFGGRVAQVTSMVGMKIHPDAGAWMAPPDYVGQLPWSLKAGWGVGAMGSLGMLFIVNVFVLFFLVNHLGMPPGLAGIILFITRIYDVFSDPMIGYLSDRTRSRWGRRRPWMFLGAFMSGLALIFVFNVPTLASDNATAVYALIVLLAFFTGFTVFYVPFMAMPAEMTDDYNERTSIMSFRVGYSNAAGIVIAAGMPALINYLGGDRGAYEISAILAGILIALTMLMTVLFTGRARVAELPQGALFGRRVFPGDRAKPAVSFSGRAQIHGFPGRGNQRQRLAVLHDVCLGAGRTWRGVRHPGGQHRRSAGIAAMDSHQPRPGQTLGLPGRHYRFRPAVHVMGAGHAGRKRSGVCTAVLFHRRFRRGGPDDGILHVARHHRVRSHQDRAGSHRAVHWSSGLYRKNRLCAGSADHGLLLFRHGPCGKHARRRRAAGKRDNRDHFRQGLDSRGPATDGDRPADDLPPHRETARRPANRSRR